MKQQDQFLEGFFTAILIELIEELYDREELSYLFSIDKTDYEVEVYYDGGEYHVTLFYAITWSEDESQYDDCSQSASFDSSIRTNYFKMKDFARDFFYEIVAKP